MVVMYAMPMGRSVDVESLLSAIRSRCEMSILADDSFEYQKQAKLRLIQQMNPTEPPTDTSALIASINRQKKTFGPGKLVQVNIGKDEQVTGVVCAGYVRFYSNKDDVSNELESLSAILGIYCGEVTLKTYEEPLSESTVGKLWSLG